ncbi:hypothetical protein TNCV_4064661 [Trichonephila clavipes]|nr:hypothetical protein TNCV_4064661 [Trichonephila clavipes]
MVMAGEHHYRVKEEPHHSGSIFDDAASLANGVASGLTFGILTTSQSSSCHTAECTTPLSSCPSSKTCPEMGLRTDSQSRHPKKQRLCNVYGPSKGQKKQILRRCGWPV